MTGAAQHLEEVLLTFATEGPPTPKRLEAFAKDHPEFRRELTELAVEMVLEPSRSLQPADTGTARAVSAAWSRFQDGVARRSDPYRSEQSEPLTDIFSRFAGPEFPKLAGRLGVTPAFLIKIRDSAIEAAGFPKALARRIADEVGQTLDAVLALLDHPASMPAGTMAKSDDKPEVGRKQTFEEAVATSGLTEAQRGHLLAMAEAERGSD